MKALLVIATLMSPMTQATPAASTADDAFADAYVTMAANTLCQKYMFNIPLGLKLYAEASGISNPDTVVMMVQNAAMNFERDLITKHQVPAFCASMRKLVSKGKPL
jgi:hypothetical protein